MARQIIQIKRYAGGIADSEKEGLTSSFLWARSCDYRTDLGKLTILPRTTKNSGTVVTGLILDGDRVGTDHYFYDDVGAIYKKTSADVWTKDRTVADSHGNGMAYFGEDDFLYYTNDVAIGRYGQIAGTPTWADDFLGAQGGIPLNTASLDLESGSSQYATAADSASLSIISDITIEGNFKPESLPAAGAEVTLVSKWDGLSDERSYFFDLAAVSGYFGDGSDGTLTISSNTTQAPTDSACTGTATTYSLSATNASFTAGQKILIHQSRGTGAGVWERNEIASYTAGTITLTNVLTNTYTSGAQVLVLNEYTNVTVNSGITWTAKAWNGTVGGILAFLANGTVAITGSVSANGVNGSSGNDPAGGAGIGFRGGAGLDGAPTVTAYQGEGTTGASGQSQSANGNGGGAGSENAAPGGEPGGGGGNGTAGTAGSNSSGREGVGGSTSGTADLTTLTFGGGGGGGARESTNNTGSGGGGGGIIFVIGTTITVTGSVTATGGTGGNPSGNSSSGGGGAGGSILLKAQTATLGSSLITAAGGSGGNGYAGNGGVGRIHLDYYTSYTGTTSPTLDVIQDSSLITNTTYQLKFGVSTDGTTTNQEFLSKSLAADPVVGTWYHWVAAWDASAAQVEFFVNGVSIGTATGAKTSIYNGTALAAIGAKFDAAGVATEFFDGKVDDVRIWNDLRTSSEIYTNKSVEVAGGSANLQAYWQVDSTTDDSTANANTLTLVAAPSYDTADVPFSSPTARQDLDQSLDTTGQTYTLPTSISESATNRQSFVPTKDPQKSIEVLIAAKGTQTWTITVHDAQNRTLTTATAATGQLPTSGDYEFIFGSVWRPVIGQTYHFHLTVPSGTSTVTTTTTADLETVDFHTYWQFLVDDNNHPIEHFIDFLAIANGRYLAKWDGITYDPHRITLPSGYHIRCLGFWREFLVLGCVVGDTLTDYEYGMLFFWDGVNDTYNFYRYVPQGAINSILSGDPLYLMAGYAGDFMIFDGGNPRKIRRMPFVKNSDTLSINRKALTMWRALVHIGFSSTSTSTGIYRGVYSYGSLHERLDETLSFDYPLSVGITQSANLEVGMVMASGTNLYISWKNGSSYGMDVVKPSNVPYATATYESLISDADKLWADKEVSTLRGYVKTLVSGDSFALKYKIDRNSNWTTGDTEDTADKKEVRLSFPKQGTRFNELQVGVDLATTNSTSPEFYALGIEIDDLQHERRT